MWKRRSHEKELQQKFDGSGGFDWGRFNGFGTGSLIVENYSIFDFFFKIINQMKWIQIKYDLIFLKFFCSRVPLLYRSLGEIKMDEKKH